MFMLLTSYSKQFKTPENNFGKISAKTQNNVDLCSIWEQKLDNCPCMQTLFYKSLFYIRLVDNTIVSK